MSTRRGGLTKGPPKHQNSHAWKANGACKKNDRELGGKLHPYSAITGVCHRCRAQIEWRRKYGKYKALTEPAKCIHCGKRAIKQSYHKMCPECAKKKCVCAKCCHPSETISGRDAEEKEREQKLLEEAMRNVRERDRRTLLRVMAKGSQKLTGKGTTSNLFTQAQQNDNTECNSEQEDDDDEEEQEEEDDDDDDELKTSDY